MIDLNLLQIEANSIKKELVQHALALSGLSMKDV